MKLLIDIVHPAHVHFYRPLINELEEQGAEVAVVSRTKDVTNDLLEHWSIPHTSIGTAGAKNRAGMAMELISRDRALLQIARRFRPDLILTRSPAGVQISRLVGATGVFDTDDGRAAGIHYRAAAPFAHVITTPWVLGEDLGKRQRTYRGYKASAYLHPDRFAPDPGVRDDLGVGADERYFLVRFSAMTASHDKHESGLSPETKRNVIDELRERGRVFVSDEGSLPADLAELALPIPPTRFHDALAFADLAVGDSQTVAAEAGLLGTPAVRASSFTGRLGYLNHLESQYGLVRSFRPDEDDDFLGAVIEIADDPDACAAWAARRAEMLDDTVDVTAWYLDLVRELAS